MGVRMTHPDLDGEIIVASSAVGIHAESGWVPVPGQDDMGEEYPDDAKRFDGQEQVRLHHPGIDGDPVIVVARSAVAEHQPRGWVEVAEEPEAEAEADLEDLTVAELRDLAKERGISPLPTTKAELIERLNEEPAEEEDDQPAEPADQESEE